MPQQDELNDPPASALAEHHPAVLPHLTAAQQHGAILLGLCESRHVAVAKHNAPRGDAETAQPRVRLGGQLGPESSNIDRNSGRSLAELVPSEDWSKRGL